ncbi:LysR family transcriptional regulator [Clostridium magnum]|uniref:HTH-type transcriptional regulator CatM n=1 Tax=Clostridium magnum DSM 2767 TaxID=1121326 RepID=A0A162RSI5_9CLOT|nr:LysR family transcriptional regulator [Clostridium magnum]KZL90319.1 HTH-type transcriptional regulator CatM [Clostridium magnum DSM 2767]SHH81986.1 DNA-binding transcriptional regulator, LysR family [Clostridium magnum DSM 2767]
MDLKQLEYFVTIVNEGTISAAAKRLNMSQPPLSTHMKLMENQLGCILFERGSRHIKLTEAGRILYSKANSLLDLSKFTLQELEAYKKGISGTLRVGVVSSVEIIFLNKLILPFHKENPDIHYEIFEGNTYELLEKLKANNLDVAIVRTPFILSSFKYINILKESMVAIGNHNFFRNCLNPDSVTLSELSAVPILLYRRWESIITDMLEQKKIKWDIFCKSDDARTTLHWANEGLGVGIVPESAIGFADKSKIAIKSISDSDLQSTIAAVYNPDTYISSTTKQFLKSIGRI